MEREPTQYQKDRASLLTHSLARTKEAHKRVQNLEEGMYHVMVPQPDINYLRDDEAPLSAYSVDVDHLFVKGMDKVVDSLLDDLYQTGPLGQEMAANIVYTLQQKELDGEGKR
jgi:hypothetical protein